MQKVDELKRILSSHEKSWNNEKIQILKNWVDTRPHIEHAALASQILQEHLDETCSLDLPTILSIAYVVNEGLELENFGDDAAQNVHEETSGTNSLTRPPDVYKETSEIDPLMDAIDQLQVELNRKEGVEK